MGRSFSKIFCYDVRILLSSDVSINVAGCISTVIKEGRQEIEDVSDLI